MKKKTYLSTKVNLLVGARFHGRLVTDFLQEEGIDNVTYTSSLPKKWNNPSLPKKRIVFVPLVIKVISSLLRIRPIRIFRELDAIIFDFLASKIMRKSDILHGFATFSLISAKKQKKNGGLFFLERACPHILYQEELLSDEARRLGVKYVRTHAYFVNRCIKEYELADKIIVPSMYTLESFVNEGIDRSKLELVRLDANFTPSNNIPEKTSNNKFVVGSVGGNPLRKGFIYLVDAWQSLELPNAELLLKTSEVELKKIPILWEKIKNDHTIRVVGYLDGIEEFYLNCDIFCLTSIDDGFGMVVFESLACGVPVIASRNVGASEMLTHGETGYIVNNRDVKSIKEHIFELYSNNNTLKLMQKNALEFYKHYQDGDGGYNSMMKRVYSNF